jgi:uncharacterized protein (DUF1800 family)
VKKTLKIFSLAKNPQTTNMNTRKISIILTTSIWLILTTIAQAKPADPKILHVLNRLSYGIRPGDIDRVQSMGVDKYIKEQLNPDSIDESPALTERLAKLNTINLSPIELVQQYDPNRLVNGQKPEPDVKKDRQKQEREILTQARDARLYRSIYSQRQLQEVMVDFWYNHFNVYADKGIDRLWVGAYEQQAIRPYALGRFRDLVGATARHPAMLFYLDNWQNVAPVTNKKGKSQGLNENYARELMELHTLGVDSGYKQDDVISLARILTGWGFKQPGQKVVDGYSFQFNANRHDFGNKIFLGQNIIGSGIGEGEQALDILSRHPNTARHISFELAQYFVSDNPPKSLVDRLTKRFLDTEGDIKSVLDSLFHSPEFMDKKYYGAKFKTPYQYIVSSVRAIDPVQDNAKLGDFYSKLHMSRYGIVNNPKPLNDFLNQLGMPIYGCPTPNGYKNTQDAWLSPDSMTRKLNFATNLGNGKLSNLFTFVPVDSALMGMTPASTQIAIQVKSDELINDLGDNFSQNTQQAIAQSPPEIRLALILGSPEFMYR